MNTSLTPQEVLSLKKEILSSPHCALPGIVESFDDVAGTAVIRLVPGETGSVKWKDGSQQGLVLERSVDADNMDGKWESELLMRVGGSFRVIFPLPCGNKPSNG